MHSLYLSPLKTPAGLIQVNAGIDLAFVWSKLPCHASIARLGTRFWISRGMGSVVTRITFGSGRTGAQSVSPWDNAIGLSSHADGAPTLPRRAHLALADSLEVTAKRLLADSALGGLGGVCALWLAGWPSAPDANAWLGAAGAVALIELAGEWLLHQHAEVRRLQAIERERDAEREQHLAERRLLNRQVTVAQREAEAAISPFGCPLAPAQTYEARHAWHAY